MSIAYKELNSAANRHHRRYEFGGTDAAKVLSTLPISEGMRSYGVL